MRKTYDFTIAILLLGMAIVCFLAEKLQIEEYFRVDKPYRLAFGGLCVLYGGFRLYRAFKADY